GAATCRGPDRGGRPDLTDWPARPLRHIGEADTAAGSAGRRRSREEPMSDEFDRDRLSTALSVVADWPVDNVSAAVVGPDGALAVHGDESRVYRLASVTKPLVAVAALLAVEEEAITLDEPAGPEGSTVRHLLAHA